MAKGPISQKQLKEPDRFIRFSQKFIAFGRQHIKLILIGFGALMVFALVWTAIRQGAASDDREASTRLSAIMSTYSAAISRDADPKAALDSVKADFATFFNEYGKTPSAHLARMDYGDLCYQAKDADGAIDAYTQALTAVGQKSGVKNLIRSGLGYAYSLKKNYAEAIRYFEMIAKDSDPTLKDDAVFNLVWLYSATGEKEKHAVMMDRLLTEFPESMYAALFREQIRN